MVKQLGAFLVLVLVCAALLGGTAAVTRERVEQNRQRQFLEAVREISGARGELPPVRWHDDVWPLCDGQTLVRGAAPGYGGPIRWLAAVAVGRTDAPSEPVLAGVRVTAHQETPGIVDFLDPGDAWLKALRGRRAADLRQLDAVSGATITSRALAQHLARTLEQPELLDGPAPAREKCAT